MKDWQRIRLARTDLTDYVVHFTKFRIAENRWPDGSGYAPPHNVFWEILNEGQDADNESNDKRGGRQGSLSQRRIRLTGHGYYTKGKADLGEDRVWSSWRTPSNPR